MITGSIHGRFQPFHNGHMEYLRAAYDRCDRLLVGITQYDLSTADKESPQHRFDKNENPFTYWERLKIIRSAIEASQLSNSRIEIVPFPIHAPREIRNFVEGDCVMFTTIYDKWNLEKIRRLRDEGFEVRILWRRRTKQIEGKNVRLAWRSGINLFRTMVPNGVPQAIAELQLGRSMDLHFERSDTRF